MSSKYPLISVIVPVYNHEKFIAQALESVINQTYSNLQILVSDDKSTDKSSEIINEYAAKDKRIEVLQNDKNLGICDNFNQLFDNVKGEYVAFFSGDDVMVQDKLEKQFLFLENHPDVVVVHHNAWLIDQNSNKKSLHQDKLIPLNNPLDWALKTDWFHAKKIAPLLPTTCLARSEYYLNARYDKSFKYKHELLFTIEDYCKHPEGKWGYIKEPLLLYRMHENNFTHNPAFTQYLNEEKFKLAEIALERCPDLKKRIEDYTMFMLYETILFKYYDEKHAETHVLKKFKKNASLYQLLLLKLAVSLNKLKVYWLFARIVNYLYYRPVYYMKYYHYNR